MQPHPPGSTGIDQDLSRKFALDWQHLQAELARLDLMIRREVRRWALAEQDPNDDYRGLYVSRLEVDALLDRPLAASWGATIDLPAEEARAFTEALHQANAQIQAIELQMQANETPSRLAHLVTAFHLDRTALDILLLCLAPAFDTRYERLYGYLQDNVTLRRPTVRLMLDLLDQAGEKQFSVATALQPAAPLVRYELVERIVESTSAPTPWLQQTWQISESLVAWLLGVYQPHTVLNGFARLYEPQAEQIYAILTSVAWTELAQFGNQPRGLNRETPLLVLWGADDYRQQAIAERCAIHWQRALLRVEMNKIVGENCTAQKAIRAALRDVRLTNAVLFLTGWDNCCAQSEQSGAELLAEFSEHPGLIVLSTLKQWQPLRDSAGRSVIQLSLPLPAYVERKALWQHFCEQYTPAAVSTPADAIKLDLDGLAGHFALSSAHIRSAVLSARDQAAQAGRAITSADLYTMARDYSNPRLSVLARKITPRYTWQDIILPSEQVSILHELVATIRYRPTVLEAWGGGDKLASSAGVTALFAGPPGTGKTMAAEVIAAELRLDLYKIDLSTVVSKYIGETEKNLERIFSEAASSNAILFFDEADAIFGKRSEVKDAHDRYANIEISYLLQRMEAYDGVTILATNLRANLDEAFTRRLQFAVDFPFPKAEDRVRIWQALFPPDVPRVANLDFAQLARRFELSGGNIRNIILSAAYLAASDGGQVTMAHLLHGARREFQKLGRLVGQEDFDLD